jgi:hypothetical protein
VGVEGAPGVQQPVGLAESFRRFPDDAFGRALLTGGVVGQRPAQGVPRAGVPRATTGIAVAVAGRGRNSLRDVGHGPNAIRPE